MKNFHKNIATLFGLGYASYAPGTLGSLAGLGLCWLLHGNPFLYITAFLVLFFVGVISSGKVEKEMGIKDPQVVIIDEFACIFLVFLFIPLRPSTIIVGFILFRLFDIVKVPPMKRCEDLKEGWGIMVDDLLAGVYTNIILLILVHFKIL